jgi:hypothetical protein
MPREVDDLSRARGRLLKRAQDMARSGQYPDPDSIAAALEAEGDFALVSSWFTDLRFRGQLQRLCSLARKTSSTDRRET